MPTPGKSPISLYFHIPFCTKKCDYCHFYVIPDKDLFKTRYMEALQLEWEKTKDFFSGYEICSVYFGGGTPYLLGPRYIGEILSWIRNENLHSLAEITLEANPENITEQGMKDFATIGINRVSLGIQSLNDSQLVTLSRQHDAAKAKKAVLDVYKAQIKNISIDLMYDLPSQKIEEWESSLQEALKLPITHLSLYNLTFEPHTVYYKKRTLLTPLLPKEEESASMYSLAKDLCREAGLVQYEISAFEKPGFASRHNTGYWTGRPFWGFGPSVFSYWNGKRFRNIANLNAYCKSLKDGVSPVDYSEELTGEDRLRELLAINLRLLRGVDLEAFQLEQGNLNLETLSSLENLKVSGFIESHQKNIRLTERGILFYDLVASEII